MNNKISKETIIRTIVLIITLINSIFVMLGKSPLPFVEEDIYICLSAIASVGATIWAWWKNNSITPEAIAGDALMNELKKQKRENCEKE